MAKKTIIDAITTLYSKLGGNLSDVLGTRSNVNFMGTGKSSEPFLDMDLNIEALGALSQSKAVNELKSAVGFATADKLNDIQAGKLLINMQKMDSFYNPPVVTNITDLATGTGNLDQKGLASLRGMTDETENIGSLERSMLDNTDYQNKKKALSDTDRSGLMSRLDEIVKNKQAKRQMTKDEYDDFIDELGGEERLEAYSDFDGTLASANKILAQDKAYTSEMESLYKAGKLDPVPGEANRERFLQKKFDEMEASGDKKLMTRDEIEELSAFDQAPPGSGGGDNFKVLNETLTQNETKYLKELIEDTGGGQFTSDIMQEVPSLKIIGNKISVNKQDINSLSKFLDDMYISDLAPSGPGVDKMPPRLRDSNNNLITKLLRNEKNVQTTPFDEAVEYNARPEDVVQNLVDQKFGIGYFDNVGESTAKRGSAREFLVEALKKENPNQTTFADIVDGVDVKAITEGGGGAAGDPIALVDKYFGPRIVEMLPSGASSEEIAIFTERVLTKVKDANGLRPGDPRFDRMTARFVEDFARGGLAKILEV